MFHVKHWASPAGILAAIAIAAGAQAAQGPFDVLEWDWRAGIVTSRNGYSVWLRLTGESRVVRLPGHAGALRGPEVALRAICHAGGPSGVLELRGELSLADHPDQPDAYTVLHPMYWILGLTGGAEERWPVAVRIGAAPPVAGELVRRLTDYTTSRPGLAVKLPGGAALAALESARAFRLEALGDGAEIDATFLPSAAMRRAAALARRHCPP